MSVQMEMSRISQNVANTYAVLEAMGCEMSSEQNSDNLAPTAGTSKVVRYDVQNLTEEQKEQARKNIGADHILVLTESELEALSQEELAQKYEKGTKIIITKEDAKNLVPTSTDSNGNIYCGCGYKNNYRLKSDGSIVEARHLTVTGFIPCIYGSKISVVGWGANDNLIKAGQYIGVFDESYNFIEVIDVSALMNLGVGTNGSYKNEANEITIDTSKRTSWENMKYFRVSCVNTGDNVIATVDKY